MTELLTAVVGVFCLGPIGWTAALVLGLWGTLVTAGGLGAVATFFGIEYGKD